VDGARRRLAQDVSDGRADRVAFQTMQKRISENPPFPARVQGVGHLDLKERQLVHGRVQLRGRLADLRLIDRSLLIVTAGGDHIIPRTNTIPLLGYVRSEDVTHLALPGGHIGLRRGLTRGSGSGVT
jgi:polyhydroxyalkanoate synthase